MTTKYRIVLVRHGESEWNLENRFCGNPYWKTCFFFIIFKSLKKSVNLKGWHDADLSAKGINEARQAGKVWPN